MAIKPGQTVIMLDGRKAVVTRIKAGEAVLSIDGKPTTRRLAGLVEHKFPVPTPSASPVSPAPTIIVKRSHLAVESGMIPRLSNEELIKFSESGMFVPIIEDSGPAIGKPIVEAGEKFEAKMTKAESGNITFTKQLFTVYGQVNRNHRLYPASEMKASIEAAKKLCKTGEFCGAVDHPWEMERLGRTCIRYDDMECRDVNENVGVGLCELEINANHSFGTGLASNLGMGCAVGLSTYGWGVARRPTEAEIEKYGLSKDSDVAIITGYELTAVDAVYRPSVKPAVMRP